MHLWIVVPTQTSVFTLQSIIIGKGLRETAPAGRGKLRYEVRVPISNNYARLSTVLHHSATEPYIL